MAAARFKKAATQVKLVNAANKAFSEVPHGIDSSTFFTVIPDEVRAAVPLIHGLEDAELAPYIDLALAALKRGSAPEDGDFEALTAAKGGASEKDGTIFTGVYIILRTAIRNRCKASIVEKDLKQMNVPPSAVSIIVSKLKAERFAIEDRSLTNQTRFPRLEELHWRVDVAISSSSLLRVFRPSILMQVRPQTSCTATAAPAYSSIYQLMLSLFTQ